MAQQRNKWLSFDPTIHAGHLIIVCGLIASVIGSYYVTQSDIAHLKSENVKRELEIALEAQERKADIETLRGTHNRAFEKLRDDMQSWFMKLNDKLDRKADK